MSGPYVAVFVTALISVSLILRAIYFFGLERFLNAAVSSLFASVMLGLAGPYVAWVFGIPMQDFLDQQEIFALYFTTSLTVLLLLVSVYRLFAQITYISQDQPADDVN